ncbi:MAG: tRNA1(Val) (adenine(37)-N6)-methyltransferase [Desulfatibacillaceae bacterium]
MSGDMEVPDQPEVTEDGILGGRIKVFQEKRGYRFSIDAVLLAFFVSARQNDRVLDLGAGCGIVPLLLAHRYPEVRVTGVEVQPRLAALAEKNAAVNRYTDRIRIVTGDLKDLPLNGVSSGYDMVVSNPPYRRVGAGRVNPDGQRAMARHEIGADLAAVLSCGRRMLRSMGKMALVYPAERLAELLHAMRESGIEPKRLRCVHSIATGPATLVLCEGVRDASTDLKVENPLVLYQNHGRYTREAAGMLY